MALESGVPACQGDARPGLARRRSLRRARRRSLRLARRRSLRRARRRSLRLARRTSKSARGRSEWAGAGPHWLLASRHEHGQPARGQARPAARLASSLADLVGRLVYLLAQL